MQPIYFWTLSIAFLSCAACSTDDSDKNRNRVLGPIPPAPQTSLFFVIDPPDAGGECAVTKGYVAYIGGPPKSSIGDPGPRQVNGHQFARIQCRISGNGTFELSLSAEKDATAFSVEGSVAGGSGTGTISVAAPGTSGEKLVSEAGACELGLGRPPFEVAAGHIWATFNCPSLSSPNQPGSQCRAQGEFVFENCDR